MKKNISLTAIIVFFSLITIVQSQEIYQNVYDSRSWLMSINISSLKYGTIDSEVEYIPINGKCSWSVRIFSSLGYYDNWRNLGIGGSFRKFLSKSAPDGTFYGTGLNIVELEEYGNTIAEGHLIFLLGPKFEIGKRFPLSEKLFVSLIGNICYYLSSEEGDEDYHPINGFGNVFPGKGICIGFVLGLSFLP